MCIIIWNILTDPIINCFYFTVGIHWIYTEIPKQTAHCCTDCYFLCTICHINNIHKNKITISRSRCYKIPRYFILPILKLQIISFNRIFCMYKKCILNHITRSINWLIAIKTKFNMRLSIHECISKICNSQIKIF